ncbi:MAG: FtsW/RodA/SpoVE family cell cycle protein [Bacilli bacterium]|nr:FtsW/RodA/SpoVE family cell cycle protein [Bacilli bacterium]
MRRRFKYLDKPLLIVTVFLFIIGLVMIFSASNVTAYMSHAVNPYYYFLRQARFLGVGLVLFFIMIGFNTKTYGKMSNLLLVGNIAALVILLIYGSAKNNAVSWFEFGFGSSKVMIQPSEFVKVISIVFLADYYENNKGKLNGWIKCLFPIGVCGGIALLIAAQPDLGTMIIYSLIVFIIFVSIPMSKEIKYKTVFIGLAVAGLGAFAILGMGKSLLRETQMERFNFKRPCDRILEDGNQVCNCYIAINNGGLTGVGLGNSTQKYLYLPEPYTDFIFAIIVEELGVIMGIIILLAYLYVIYRILVIGRRSYTNRGAILCYGVAFYIFLHIAVNLLGIMGLMPMTGVPLPFMSYGGSYTICLVAALTIVQRVSIDNGLHRE